MDKKVEILFSSKIPGEFEMNLIIEYWEKYMKNELYGDDDVSIENYECVENVVKKYSACRVIHKYCEDCGEAIYDIALNIGDAIFYYNMEVRSNKCKFCYNLVNV